MSDNMKNVNRDDRPPLRMQNIPSNVTRRHAEKITADAVKDSTASSGGDNGEQFSLNDDRRVKVLSPGAMVAKRFFRNRIAVVGLAILAFMFLFSFLGGLITPYSEDQQFYRIEYQNKEYAGVAENDEFRFAAAEGQKYDSATHAQFIRALNSAPADAPAAAPAPAGGSGGSGIVKPGAVGVGSLTSFSYRDMTYYIYKDGEDFYRVALGDGTIIGIEYKDIINSSIAGQKLSFDFQYNALLAKATGESSFTVDGEDYALDEDGLVTSDGEEIAFISRYVVNPLSPDIFISRAFQEELQDSLQQAKRDGEAEFLFTDEDGETHEYLVRWRPNYNNWQVLQETETRVYDSYASPSRAHWLGTDRNGMDMLTRLMYGGRVSLIIGFIVEFIATLLGVILGGIAGYFGKWVDNLIMRIVDIFYCIPSMPIIIILGAAMDAMSVDPQIRMIYLMLILGFLGWPSVARLVRGQILSLREQEFMTATEAGGIRVSRRIFKHLIPNVIPQLIVSVSMGVGGTIITESTLSFLGLGVKFPFASWGNIINDVNNTFVLTTYWFIWIPAGTLLLLTVLAFNLVGDGLRDAFDPRMKR